MQSFSELEELYKHVEKHAAEYKYPHQIANLFQALRDLKYEEKKEDEARKAQWEVDFFNFVIADGELKPKFKGTNGKGQPFQYPDICKLDDETLDCLEERFNSTSNSFIRSRYAHILWCSPKKHEKYAKAAVDAYLELLKIYEEKDKEDPEGHYGLDVRVTVKNAFPLAYQSRYRLDDVKSEVKRLIKGFNPRSSSFLAVKAGLVRLMLEEKGKFGRQDFAEVKDSCWDLAESKIKAEKFSQAISVLQLGERIDKKLDQQTQEWRRHIAECYEKLMNQRPEGDLAALTFCHSAIENYRIIKDKKKIEELEKKYLELKGSQKLTRFKQEIDISEQVAKWREMAEKLVEENSPEDIIRILIAHKDILPKYKDMEKIVEGHAKEFPLQHIVPAEILDQSGHPAQHFTDEEEKKYFGVLRQYDMEIKLGRVFLINEIFYAAIRKGKLSAKIIIDFLLQNSWYGKDIHCKTPSSKEMVYNWLNLLAPAINEYFEQVSNHLANPQNKPNLVLAIDSLTLKLEGLLRDICQFCGVTTFYMIPDAKGRNVVREKDISALLREELIAKLFEEDDLLFFKFVLVEKAGLNLRHKIAHALMFFEEYNINLIHLLLILLLRLGKYDFQQEKPKAE